MRHRMKTVKLNRSRGHMASLAKNLVRSLFLEEGITTTETKAKWTRSLAEHLISIAKKGDLASLRRLIAATGSKEVAQKILAITKRLGGRSSGHLRLTKTGIRVGDKAVMVKVEFLFEEIKKETSVKEKKPRSKRPEKVTEPVAEGAVVKE